MAAALMVASLALPSTARSHPTTDARLAVVEAQLRDEPNNATLYLARGEAHRRAREWDAALADLECALELDPALDDTRLALARVHYERGAPSQALPAIETLLADHPRSSEAHQLRARALRAVGRFDESAAEYNALLEHLSEPRPEHYVERARVLVAGGRVDDALRGLDDGLVRLGPVATLQLTAVEIEVQRGGFDAAAQRLEKLLEGTPGQVFWLTRRAEILEMAGRLDDARAAFQLALASAPARNASRVAALHDVENRIRDGLTRLGGR